MRIFELNREAEISNSIMVEFQYGKKRNIDSLKPLTETRGTVNYVDLYTKIFNQYIWEELKYGNLKAKEIYLKENIFNSIPNCFFENIDIKISVIEGLENNGQGSIDIVGPLSENGKLRNLKGEFIFYFYDFDIGNVFSTIFAHELLHAYEEWNRLKKNKETIKQKIKRNNYSHTINYINSPNKLMRELSQVLYFLTDFEQRAYLQSLDCMLKNEIEKIVDSNTAYNVLLQNTVYKKYIDIGNIIKNISSIKDNDTQKLVIDIYNACTKENEISFNKIKMMLIKKWRRCWKKFRKTSSKILYDIYYNNNDTGYQGTYNWFKL